MKVMIYGKPSYLDSRLMGSLESFINLEHDYTTFFILRIQARVQFYEYR